MLQKVLQKSKETKHTEKVTLLDTTEEPLATPSTQTTKGIPLVTTTAVAGFTSLDISISEQDIKGYYTIPEFADRNIDFMLRVSGSSMYPKYNSGDVVACKLIKESTFIQWNKPHVVATQEQGIIVKRIKEGKNGTLIMVSDNKHYPPFNIPKSEIKSIALVVGVVRLE